jgi:hypothetical protein
MSERINVAAEVQHIRGKGRQVVADAKERILVALLAGITPRAAQLGMTRAELREAILEVAIENHLTQYISVANRA